MGIVSLYRNGLLEVWPDVLNPSMDDRAAPDLGPVALGEAEPMYTSPQQFFARTHMTDSMEELIEDVASTLSGKGGSSIFLLLSFFGGGKTHTMVALYHAFRNPACLPERLAAKVAEAGKPIILIMDGNRREFMPTPSQPHVEGGFTVSTAWGMLAYRLGAYALVRDLDSGDAECPDVSKIEEVLRQAKAPVLILMDEVVIHLHNLMNTPALRGYAERFKVFLDRLARAVSNCRNVVLVVAVQAEVRPSESGVEVLMEDMYRESASAVYDAMSRLSSRIITPVPPGDIVKVLQKQIFKTVPEAEASKAKERLYRAYRAHRDLFGAESDWELKITAKTATPKETYPFHPKYVEVLHEFISRNRQMQKTRDAVKVTRKVVRRLLQRGVEDPDFIMPWHIGLDSPELLNKIVGSGFPQFIAVVQRDITSQDGRLGLVAECSKPELALRLATAIFLKTFTYETHKMPLKTFPDLKEAALMAYEPSTFNTNGWQPADIATALEEMTAHLRHFNGVDGRYWFDPYKSIIEYVERRADELFHGPRQQLYAEIAAQAKAILARREKGFKEEHVFREDRVYIDYFSGPKPTIPDDDSLKLVVALRPDADLEGYIFRTESGAKRVFRNTVAVLMPRKESHEDRFDSLLRLAAKLKAAEEANQEIKDLYEEEDVRKIQQERLKKYEQNVELSLQELLLSTLREVAYPASERGMDVVGHVETSEANSLIAQAEAGLRDARTGPKLRERFSFAELHEFLKRAVGWDLVDGQSAVEMRKILEVFYTNPVAPFTVRGAVEEALKEGLKTLDIGIKAKGVLYWKEIGSAGCRLPQRIGGDDEALPYRLAAREFRDELLKDSGTKAYQDRLEVRYYEVEFAGKTIRLEDLDRYADWERILKDGFVRPRVKVVPRGFLVTVSPSSLTVDQGEAPCVKVDVQPAGGYDLEVRLEVSAGEVKPESAKPPFTADWTLPPLNDAGTFIFAIRGVGPDRISGEATLTVEVKGAEELVTTDRLDVSHAGAKLVDLTVADLLSARLAVEKVVALGLKASLNMKCAIGDSVALTFADADLSVANLLVPKIAGMVLSIQALKTSADGTLRLSPPALLDERTITALSVLNGKATFRLLVKRR